MDNTLKSIAHFVFEAIYKNIENKLNTLKTEIMSNWYVRKHTHTNRKTTNDKRLKKANEPSAVSSLLWHNQTERIRMAQMSRELVAEMRAHN